MTLIQDVTRDGYAFIERFMPLRQTSEVLGLIGNAITLMVGNRVHSLTPQKNAPPNTYSGAYGFGAFPLHTDLAHWYLPPRYLMLRCVRGFDSVATFVKDGHEIIGEVGEAVLRRALVRPRRPICGKFPLLRLYGRDYEASGMLRWDERFIRPATDAGGLGVNRVRAFLAGLDGVRVVLSNPGDTLILDNWRVLHGRSAVPERCADRVIHRAYLEKLR